MHSARRRNLLAAIGSGLALMLIGQIAIAGPAKASKKIESVPGQYVVELKQNLFTYSRVDLELKLGGKIIREVRPNLVTIQKTTRGSRELTTRRLNALSEVALAEPNYIFRANVSPNDPEYSKLWGMHNSGTLDTDGSKGLSGIDVNVEKAWEIQKGSKDVIVAIIDTGVDYTHPELAKNIWTNEAEAKGVKGVDDDKNGYIDDIHGYNFAANTGDPLDDNGHGTHVAGTIGAEPNNGIGVAGVNWNVSIMALKFLDAGGGGSLDAAIAAMDYARKSKARILSNSWGGNVVSELLEKAIGQTRDAGQLFVVAAGNDTENNDTGATIPATYKFDNILSVAAVDNRGEIADFSNYGTKTVDVGAPGVNILSTSKGGGYETLSGTSMACPHVTGIAALVLAENPTMTYQELKVRIVQSARPIVALKGKVSSGGIADAYYALSNMVPPADPNDPSVWGEKRSYAVSSDHPYIDKTVKSFTIKVPGARRISVHFSKFETEAGYDKLQFTGTNGENFGSWSGNQSGRFGPIVDGDTMVLKFTSDSSNTGYGFDVDSVSVDQ